MSKLLPVIKEAHNVVLGILAKVQDIVLKLVEHPVVALHGLLDLVDRLLQEVAHAQIVGRQRLEVLAHLSQALGEEQHDASGGFHGGGRGLERLELVDERQQIGVVLLDDARQHVQQRDLGVARLDIGQFEHGTEAEAQALLLGVVEVVTESQAILERLENLFALELLECCLYY